MLMHAYFVGMRSRATTPYRRGLLALLQVAFLSAVSTACVGQDVQTHLAPTHRGRGDVTLDSEDNGPTLKSRVDLVVVPVSVTNERDQFVPGLTKSSFKLYEDKRPQEIHHFSTEDAPISIGVIFDSSASMDERFEFTRKAVLRFLIESNPQDEFFLVSLNQRPELRVDFTSSVDIRSPRAQSLLTQGLENTLEKCK